MPASRRALAVPPVERISTPISPDSARAKGSRPVLSDREIRARAIFTGWSGGLSPGSGAVVSERVAGERFRRDGLLDDGFRPGRRRTRFPPAGQRDRGQTRQQDRPKPQRPAAAEKRRRRGAAGGVAGEEFDFGTHGKVGERLLLYAAKRRRAQRRSCTAKYVPVMAQRGRAGLPVLRRSPSGRGDCPPETFPPAQREARAPTRRRFSASLPVGKGLLYGGLEIAVIILSKHPFYP